MKRIALFTLQDNANYGNRLQNYALHKVLTDMDFEVDSVVYRESILKYDPSYLRKIKVKECLCLLGNKSYLRECSKVRRAVACQKFSRQMTNRIFIDPSSWHETAIKYDYAITGSDQVWHNWGIQSLPDELSYFYLQAFPPEKRIAYAPSFGFTAFPVKDILAHREGLLGIRALSCRETEGCNLICDLTGRRAVHTLDPVLLLTSEEWSKIEKKPRTEIKKPFLLKFFLGDVPDDYQEEINHIQTEHNLHHIDLNDITIPTWYGVSPAEFVWLIHNADIICTDSFHMAAFSIIFSRNLRVYHRVQTGFNDMFGRLHSLLEPLGLMNLVFGDGKAVDFSTTLASKEAAYLERERNTSLAYLRNSLSCDA